MFIYKENLVTHLQDLIQEIQETHDSEVAEMWTPGSIGQMLLEDLIYDHQEEVLKQLFPHGRPETNDGEGVEPGDPTVVTTKVYLYGYLKTTGTMDGEMVDDYDFDPSEPVDEEGEAE